MPLAFSVEFQSRDVKKFILWISQFALHLCMKNNARMSKIKIQRFAIEIYFFEWPYLSQCLMYMTNFAHVSIVFDALSENDEQIEKF